MCRSVHVTGVGADVVTSPLPFGERLAATSPPCSSTHSAACESAPATCFERHIMTHATADMRVQCVCTELSSSICVLETSTGSGNYLFQAAVVVRGGGIFAAELQSAVSASAVVTLWPHVPVVCFVSAAVAAMDRSKLPAARLGRPQHQY